MPVNNGEYINHIGLVLDRSGSMNYLASQVVQIADNQVRYLAQRSQELDQETRATVYTFDDRVECIYYDKDVLRLPSLAGNYHIGGSTALIDASLKSVDDLKQTATLYGDHAFLIFVLTDGLENASISSPKSLITELRNLPDNWTVAVLVPNARAVFEAKQLGFSPDNIQVWDTTEKGIQEVGRRIQKATDNFMVARPQGVRGAKNIFGLDLNNLNVNALQPLPFNTYEIVSNGPLVGDIRPIVEALTGRTYVIGNSHYELSKTETIQPDKRIFVQDKDSRVVYGGSQARKILGLPNEYVMVKPEQHPKYKIFIQSKAVNRKCMPNRDILVLK